VQLWQGKIGRECVGNCLIGLDLAGQKVLGAHSVKTRPELQELDRRMSRYVTIGSGTPEIKEFGVGNGGLLVKERCDKRSKRKGTIVGV
jgi:hypothetical protein